MTELETALSPDPALKIRVFALTNASVLELQLHVEGNGFRTWTFWIWIFWIWTFWVWIFWIWIFWTLWTLQTQQCCDWFHRYRWNIQNAATSEQEGA